ncbi:hypothetical protein ZWY2020_024591 [Hordeum vulgare]|nr:hypothetical protein ZWY2020_024591 [Hordeum vulgare]
MTPAERQQLAFSLAALAAELSDHAVELCRSRAMVAADGCRDSGSSDSDSRHSGSVSSLQPDEKVRSTPAPPVLPKVSIPDPAVLSLPSLSAPAVVQNAEVKKLNSPTPANLPDVNDHSAGWQSELAPVVHNAEPENVRSLAPSALCKMVDDFAQRSELSLEVVLQNGEPADKDKHSSPAPAVLPKVSAPELHNAEEPDKVSSPAPEVIIHKVVDGSALSLEAGLKVDERADRRSAGKAAAEERSQAREKARQELVKTERSAMTSHRVHPVDMEQLGIVHVEHMVSQQRRPGVPPSLLQQLGLFLRADEDDGGEQQQQQQSSVPGVEDLEEGRFVVGLHATSGMLEMLASKS